MHKMEEMIKMSGDSLWSDQALVIHCIGYSVPYINDERDFGELRVYFNTETWDVNHDGLIYTDSGFLKSIREAFGTNDIEYSEQGMQGDDFVSFDVGAEFLSEWED